MGWAFTFSSRIESVLHSQSERNSVLAHYNPFTQKVVKVDRRTLWHTARNAEQAFAFEVLKRILKRWPHRKAGTGKTLLALASALKRIRSTDDPVGAPHRLPLEQDLGYLPGDEAKVAPYSRTRCSATRNMIKHSWDRAAPTCG